MVALHRTRACVRKHNENDKWCCERTLSATLRAARGERKHGAHTSYFYLKPAARHTVPAFIRAARARAGDRLRPVRLRNSSAQQDARKHVHTARQHNLSYLILPLRHARALFDTMRAAISAVNTHTHCEWRAIFHRCARAYINRLRCCRRYAASISRARKSIRLARSQVRACCCRARRLSLPVVVIALPSRAVVDNTQRCARAHAQVDWLCASKHG